MWFSPMVGQFVVVEQMGHSCCEVGIALASVKCKSPLARQSELSLDPFSFSVGAQASKEWGNSAMHYHKAALAGLEPVGMHGKKIPSSCPFSLAWSCQCVAGDFLA